MAASFIEEKDANDVTKKVMTELLDTDKHVPAGVLYANGAIVATAAPLPVGGDDLTDIITELTAIKTSVQLLDNAISGSEIQADIVSGTVTATGSVSFGIPAGATKWQVQKNYTTAQAGVDVRAPASGKRMAVKWGYVSWSGANACRITIWQGANADTTFSEGTDKWLFDKTLAASADGGAILSFPDGYPWETDTTDHELHITISADKVVSVSLIGDDRT